MSAAAVLREARAAGVKLSSAGEKLRYEAPAERLTQDLVERLRAHKAALLDLLEAEQMAAEARRQRVLAMLTGTRKYALVVDDPDTDPVILALAIRQTDGSAVTCELAIPAARYDPFLLLELVARHGATPH